MNHPLVALVVCLAVGALLARLTDVADALVSIPGRVSRWRERRSLERRWRLYSSTVGQLLVASPAPECTRPCCIHLHQADPPPGWDPPSAAPVTQNLSAYIEGGIVSARQGLDPAKIRDEVIDGVRWANEQVANYALRNPPPKLAPDFPDPAKDDCPHWLPAIGIVPHKYRSPCGLDRGHDGDHDPINPAVVERARAILKRLPYGTQVGDVSAWDKAFAKLDQEVRAR